MIDIHTGWLVLIAFLAGLSFFLLGLLYLLFTWAKNWIDREEMPPARDLAFIGSIAEMADHKTASYEDYAGGLAMIGFLIFLGLIGVVLCIQYWPIRWLGIIIGSATGSMYSLRWMRDTKKSVDKVKDIAHDHNTEEE